MNESLPPTPPPPDPFTPEITTVELGSTFYRAHPSLYGATQFNPGPRGGGRFHFFGDPIVPALYMPTTPEAAVAETLLHELPVGKPSRLGRDEYEYMRLSTIKVNRPLQVAVFHGFGLRRLGVTANQLTDTPASRYPKTRPWAAAAHQAGAHGAVWMSRQLNSDQSFVLFGDRVAVADLEEIPSGRLPFGAGPGRDWLVDICAPLGITVAP